MNYVNRNGKLETTEPETVTVGVGKSFASVDEMLADLEKNRTWIDRLQSIWYHYFWNYVSGIPGYVRRFIQRGRRGWAKCDAWSFDCYLAKVISEGIEYLVTHGNTCYTKKDIKNLKQIQTTFETVEQIHEHNMYYIPLKEFTWKKYKAGKRFGTMMAKKYPNRYHVMTLREVRKFEKGFDLFKEYYFRLWD